MPTATGTLDLAELAEAVAPTVLGLATAVASAGNLSPRQTLACIRSVLDTLEAEAIAPCGCERQGPTVDHDARWCALDPRNAAEALVAIHGDGEPEPDTEPDVSDIVTDGNDYGCEGCCDPEGCPECRPASAGPCCALHSARPADIGPCER